MTSDPKSPFYTIWPSLLLAVIAAFVVPIAWVKYADRFRPELFNFHPLVIAIYIPLAFGLFWALFVALHVAVVPSLAQARPGRMTCAQVLFVLSLVLSFPCFYVEFHSLKLLKEARAAEIERFKKAGQQEQWDRQAASLQILAKGILTFSEPLTPPQSWALGNYFDFHPLAAQDCFHAAQQYPFSLSVLIHLAGNKSCTADALQVLCNNGLAIQAASHPLYPSVDALQRAIAANPNTSPALLSELLQNQLSSVRIAAAKNPNLPKSQKIAYLRGRFSTANLDERQYAAGDPDTPTDVLELLAAEIRFAGALANNPSTPVTVLQHIADTTDNKMIRTQARQNLSSHHAN